MYTHFSLYVAGKSIGAGTRARKHVRNMPSCWCGDGAVVASCASCSIIFIGFFKSADVASLLKTQSAKLNWG